MEKFTKEKLQEKLFGAPLSDEELETVSGGTNLGHISCSNPNCKLYRSRYFGGYGPTCLA